MIMLFAICALPVLQTENKDNKNNTVLPFMKVETVGISPISQNEKIFYKKNAADKIVREFKETPVYIVRYEQKGEKTTSRFEKYGNASCVFFTDDNKWLSASIDGKGAIPKGYVLRAHTVASKNKLNADNVLEVQEASIIEFYLKPEDLSVNFR